MPSIKPFETPALGLRPSETGIETVAGNARRLGGFYNQGAGALEGLAAADKNAFGSAGRAIGSGIQAAGDAYVNYVDHKEISAGSLHGTQLMANLTDQWKQIISNPKLDPNDPSIAQKFLEQKLEPALQQFKDDSGFFTTEKSQQFAEHMADSFRQQMFKDTAADVSKLAEIATRANYKGTVNSLSAMATNDPSKTDFALGMADHTIGSKIDSSPTLDPVTKASLHSELRTSAKQDIAIAGAIGAIQKSSTPEATAQEWLKKYPDLIGDQGKMLTGYAKQQVRAQNYDYELNRRRDKEIATDKSNDARDKYIGDIYSKDPRLANDPTAKKIVDDKDLLPTAKANLLALQARELKPETDSRISQQTFVGLLKDLHNPDADPDAIMEKAWKARVADPGAPNSLTERDFNQFRAEVVARKTPEGAALASDRNEFFKQYGPTIDQGMKQGNATPLGAQGIYKAEQDARRVEQFLKSKGLDPHLAYDPTSPYFLGRPERISAYRPTMQEQMEFDKQAQGKKSETAMPAIPPADQRSPGLYETPKGKLRWTGTGWVQP